jgi:F-type H+-transporting ATPase subunit delta
MADAITIVRPYAVAAFRLAKEKKTLAKWSEMLSYAAAVAANPQMKAVIDNPKVIAADLERLFLSVCEKKLDKAGENMIKLLAEYGRLALLPEVATAFEELKAQDEGVLEAEITAAAKPSDSEVKALVKRLETKFGKKIEASVKLDPEIIGGIKIVIGDTVIDASVRGQLQELAYALKA